MNWSSSMADSRTLIDSDRLVAADLSRSMPHGSHRFCVTWQNSRPVAAEVLVGGPLKKTTRDRSQGSLFCSWLACGALALVLGCGDSAMGPGGDGGTGDGGGADGSVSKPDSLCLGASSTSMTTLV